MDEATKTKRHVVGEHDFTTIHNGSTSANGEKALEWETGLRISMKERAAFICGESKT